MKVPFERIGKRWLLERKNKMGIHTEAIYVDEVFEKIEDFVKSSKKNKTWYVITPINYDLAVSFFQPGLSKNEFEKKILERYNWLKSQGEDVQLHLHLSRFPTMSLEKEKKMLDDALVWMEENGFHPTKIVFGWFRSDEGIEEYAKSKGLEIVRHEDEACMHDFDLV